ncbi:unnamed protein product [Fraxinus pennsylvanica]|uniref:Disease resistance R13L4/SHOC-2-like LRR domain-containing protein n=1 Tax=Fraxinus pennsylvanica TaxID=56036 RepID=A0AAD1ZEI4_9LAMI|nr:unnamed protein product [Fraxinus pennsylvanica]
MTVNSQHQNLWFRKHSLHQIDCYLQNIRAGSRMSIEGMIVLCKFSTVENKLTVLNLYNCCNLTAIPDLSEHKSLEKLILELCVNLKTIHKSVGGLDTLRHLNLRECSSLVEFPSDVSGLKRLEVLILSGCLQLKNLPWNIGSMKSLQELLADRTAIDELPETIFRLTCLEKLSLNHCKSLKRLPKCIGKLSSLRELSLLGSALEELPDSIGFLGNLEILNLMWCESLIAIPDSIGNLKSLTELLLNGSSIEVIPASVGSLYYLKDLSVGDCKRLHTLPVTIEGLSSMIAFQLDRTLITGLPHQIGFLKSLKKLEIRDCKNLSTLPESIANLSALHTLILNKTVIIELPESIGLLENLIVLRLNQCKKLCKLPDSFGKLKNLYHLFMEETAITELPETFGMLDNLRTLKMAKKPYGQASRISLVSEPATSAKRKELNAANCTSLESISDLSNLQYLIEIEFTNCEKLMDLPGVEKLMSLKSQVVDGSSRAVKCWIKWSYENNLVFSCHSRGWISRLLVVGQRKVRKTSSHHAPCAPCYPRSKIAYAVALRNLYNLCVPGSEIPDWFTRDELRFSTKKNEAIRSVIIAVVVSKNSQINQDSTLDELPVIAEIEAKILRVNRAVYSHAMNLKGIPNTEDDQLYLCRYPDYHPLVSILENDDKIQNNEVCRLLRNTRYLKLYSRRWTGRKWSPLPGVCIWQFKAAFR